MSQAQQNLSKEQAAKIRHQQEKSDPRFWMKYNWKHPNRPMDSYDFRTDDGDKLDYLLSDDGPLNPNQWGNVVILLWARGCLKTTSVTGVTGWGLDKYPYLETLMTAPRQDQVREFMTKFKENINDTSLVDKRERNRMGHQQFETMVQRQSGEELTLTSDLKSQTAWDEDALRGYHSQVGIIDEFQDVDESTFSIFLEDIDQSVSEVDYFPTIFVIGTPKLKNSFFERLWLTSDQKTWDQEKGEWIQQDSVGSYAPPSVCDVCGEMVDATLDECPECGGDIETEFDPFTITGWHIDQPNCPIHSPGKIEYNRQRYPEKQFKNEVLAQFYSPEDNFLSESHVRGCFDDYDGMGSAGWSDERLSEDSHVALTVDWGGGQGQDASDTTFTVGEHTERSKDDETPYEINILNHRFVDHDVTQTEEEKMVRRWMTRYNPDIVLVDEGFNGQRRKNLQEDYPQTVKGINYGRVSPAEDLKWRENDNGNEVLFTADKTYCAESMVSAMKNGLYKIPTQDLSFGSKRDNGTKLINQLTATAKDYTETPSGTKKLKVIAEQNDDAFDTFVYQWVAHKKVDADPGLMDFSLNTRRGY